MKFLLPAFLLVLFVACTNKKGSTTSPGKCQIIQIGVSDLSDPSQNSTRTYTYNNEGKVSTATMDSNTSVYTYSGTTILITTTGTLASTDSITLNSEGYLQTDYNRFENFYTLSTYTYNSNGEISEVNAGPIGNSPGQTIIQYFTYTNGDLTSIVQGTDTSYLTYYTNKPYAAGDYIQISQFLSDPAATYIQNTHLVQSLTENGGIANFSYTFDNTGKITSMTATTGGDVLTFVYTYQCDQ